MYPVSDVKHQIHVTLTILEDLVTCLDRAERCKWEEPWVRTTHSSNKPRLPFSSAQSWKRCQEFLETMILASSNKPNFKRILFNMKSAAISLETWDEILALTKTLIITKIEKGQMSVVFESVNRWRCGTLPSGLVHTVGVGWVVAQRLRILLY